MRTFASTASRQPRIRDARHAVAGCAYPDEDEPRHWRALGIPSPAAGIDYLIGDPGERVRGIGTAVIRAFVTDVVFGQHPEWTHACASPQAANVASCRALERAGFAYVGGFDSEHGPTRLFAADRPATLER